MYNVKRKGRRADMYGTFENGRQTKQDVIAGHAIWSVRA